MRFFARIVGYNLLPWGTAGLAYVMLTPGEQNLAALAGSAAISLGAMALAVADEH